MKKTIISVCVCIVILVASIGILQWRSQNADERMSQTIEITDKKTDQEASFDDTDQPSVPVNPRLENGVFVIGSPDAPVTITEYSSLSCPHCATFHKDTLGNLKKNYIETGKVKFYFHSFPLNQSAIAGSLLLKCIDLNDRYNFMEMLFEQQSNWAFDANYKTKLKQYAALLGVSNSKADSCMNDSAAEEDMFQKMQLANAAHKINSTPTFVIQPGNEILTGAQNYGVFSKQIESLLQAE